MDTSSTSIATKVLKDLTLKESIEPIDIKDYPAALELTEQAIVEYKTLLATVKRSMQKAEDEMCREISKERVLIDGEQRMLFKSRDLRDAEMRRRLEGHSHYTIWLNQVLEFQEKIGFLKAKYNKLRREFRLLQDEYILSGQRTFREID